jgi:hypothetical protein
MQCDAEVSELTRPGEEFVVIFGGSIKTALWLDRHRIGIAFGVKDENKAWMPLAAGTNV